MNYNEQTVSGTVYKRSNITIKNYNKGEGYVNTGTN